MKAAALIVVLIASAAALAACGPSSDMKGMESAEKTQGTVHKAVGVVKNVDPAKSAVTLAHEPVKSLKWSAMTMSFAVKDKALLDKLVTGKKVEFEFVQQGTNYVITSVK